MANRANDWFRQAGRDLERARALDTLYIPTRYPDSHAEGAPFEHYGPLQREEAIRSTDAPVSERARTWPLERLPVPAETLVYTPEEWHVLARARGRFYRTLVAETVWIFLREGEALPDAVAADSPSA